MISLPTTTVKYLALATFIALVVSFLPTGLLEVPYAHAQPAHSISDNQPEANDVACESGGGLFGAQPPGCWIPLAFAVIGEAAFGVAKWFTQGGGFIMDETILFTIDSSHYNSAMVRSGWVIIRDLVNMAFIFVLLFIAFKMILQLDTANAKRSIATIIVVGLLLNFSFFLTAFVIDIGNVFGTFFFDSLNVSVVNNANNTAVVATISDSLVQSLQLPTTDAGGGTIRVTLVQEAISNLMGAVVLFIAGMTFIAAGFMFISRTIILMGALIASPAAFAALVLPNTKKYFSQWVGILTGNTFVLPIYLLMLSIILIIISNDAFYSVVGNVPGSGQSLSGATNIGNGSSFEDNSGIVLNFLLIIAFLLGAQKAAASFAGSMNSAASSMAKKYTGVGATAALGAGAFAYRNSVGRIAQRASESDGLKKWGSESFAGRQVLKTVNFGAKATGDVRNIAGVSKATNALAGVNIGAGTKQNARANIAASEEKQFKREKEIADSMGYDEALVKPKEQTLERERENLKTLKRTGASDAVIKAKRNLIEQLDEDIEKDKAARGLKYADDVKDRGIFRSWSTLRTKDRNAKLGKKLKKELGKKIK